MGCTFATALVQKAGTAPTTRKALQAAMETMGCRKPRPERDGSLPSGYVTLEMYQQRKSAWVSMADPVLLTDPDAAEPFLMRLALALGQTILYFVNVDSDLLLLAAIDGMQMQRLHCGEAEEDLPPDSEELNLFDALLPDDAARTELRRIMAGRYTCSEEAARKAAMLFGCTTEVLMPDEEARSFGSLYYILPEDLDVWRVPEGALPALKIIQDEPALTNPAAVEAISIGGMSHGLTVYVQAIGYDPLTVRIPVAALISGERLRGKRAYEPLTAADYLRAVPERIVFRDGTGGWRVDFPEAEISRGVRACTIYDHRWARETERATLCLWLPFFGDGEGGENRVFLLPDENRDAGAAVSFPRTSFRKPWLGSYPWLEGYEE